jgi:hypothetical protein
VYFPTAVGATWVYVEGPNEYTQVVTGVETAGGVTVVTVAEHHVQQPGQRPGPPRKVAVGPEGVSVLDDGQSWDPPFPLLKLPTAAGQRPEPTDFRRGDSRYTLDQVVGEPEFVDVPAGRFLAVPVTVSVAVSVGPAGWSEPATLWYAPNVGLVRLRQGDRDRVLKDFTPGKK